MRIQLITDRTKKLQGFDGIEVSDFSSPSAFDAFDLTVIDLQSESIWVNRERDQTQIQKQADLITLGRMISDSRLCKVLVLLPQNYRYRFDYGYTPGNGNTYKSSKNLKDMLGNVSTYILGGFLSDVPELAYGHSETTIDGLRLGADFYAVPSYAPSIEVFAMSQAGGVTAFRTTDDIGITTLLVANKESLLAVAKLFGFVMKDEEGLPSWLDDVVFLDEGDLRTQLENVNEEIDRLSSKAEGIKDTLSRYSAKKAVLCQKGKALERTARSMLAEILGIDDEFEDEREEDFLFESAKTDLCFEIKGTSGNLKRQHVSRAFDHAQIHADQLEADSVEKESKAILVFSSEIEKPPNERGPYPDEQVTIANRTGVGILSAETLLRCYEAKLRGEMNSEKFVGLLSNASGLIEYEHDV